MCRINWACIPKQNSCNHCLSSLSATQVTTLRLKQPTCFCSVGCMVVVEMPGVHNQIAIGFHKKILFERETSQLHLSFETNRKHCFVMCHAHNRHATEMTKIYLK